MIFVRSMQSVRAFLKFFVFTRGRLGMRLRLFFQTQGPVFIKIGQILSTRYDLLPKEDCDELKKLLDEVPAVPYNEIRELFIQDFGKPPEAYFNHFSSDPIAAASISQVYRGTLHDGSDVAIKVRRTKLMGTIAPDIALLRGLAKIGQLFSKTLRHIDVTEVLRQLESWLQQEFDFAHEVQNMERMREYYKTVAQTIAPDAQHVVIPKVYADLCSDNVITMEFIHGVPVTQINTIAHDSHYDVQASLFRYARVTVRTWLYSKNVYFHADPHPANIMVLPEGRLAILDWGLVGEFDASTNDETKQLLLDVYLNDPQRVITSCLRMCHATNDRYAHAIEHDIQQYLEKTSFSAIGYWFMGIIQILVKHRVPLPYNIVQFGRAQTVFDGLLETAVPHTPATVLFQKEFERGLRHRTIQNILETDITSVVYTLSEKIKQSPKLINRFINAYFEDPHELIHDVSTAFRVKV